MRLLAIFVVCELVTILNLYFKLYHNSVRSAPKNRPTPPKLKKNETSVCISDPLRKY